MDVISEIYFVFKLFKNDIVVTCFYPFSKLTEIWYRRTLLCPYFEFNVYFFKIFVIHIFWANVFGKISSN